LAKLTWKDAAIVVLNNYPDGLHYSDITQRIIEQRLVTDFGATPASTLSAALSSDIRSNSNNSVFEKIGKAKYKIKPGTQIPTVNAESSNTQIAQSLVEDEEEVDYGYINAYGMYWDSVLVQRKTDFSILKNKLSRYRAINLKNCFCFY
jgi:hypothetical protein